MNEPAPAARAEKVAPDIWRLPLRGVNAYALQTAQGTTLVDAGNPGDAPRILAMLQAAGLPAPGLILLTHGDVDHAGGVRGLLSTGAAPGVRTTAAEAAILAGGGHPRLLRRLGRMMSGRVACSAPLQPGESVCGLTVLETPGHTPGHCSLLRGSDRVLFAGDALSVHGSEVRLARPPFTQDWEAAFASLQRLADMQPSLLLPGHGPPLPQPAAALQQALRTQERPRRWFA